MRRTTFVPLLMLCAALCALTASAADEAKVFYCSPDGRDAADAGSKEKPWKTVQYALTQIGKDGGATLLLGDGAYRAPASNWQFDKPVTVRAQNPLKASFERIYLNGAKNLVLEDLTIDRKSGTTAANVLHTGGGTSYCTIRRCLVTHGTGGHDNTDALKINDRSHHMLIEENVIFDGTDEEVDILQDVHDLVFRRNIIYQDKVVKPEALVSNKMRARRVMYDGNLFANLNADASNGALRFGGSEKAGEECEAMVALGNLFVNTTGRGALTFGGAKKCLAANNVFVNHDDRRTGAVVFYSNYPKGDLANDELYVIHNIFYNVSGTRGRPLYDFPPKEQVAYPKKWAFSQNLYWNGGKAVPKAGVHDPTAEAGAILEDPQFEGDPAKLTGKPSRDWFDVLKLKKTSPFLARPVDLMKLDLPAELKEFIEDYLDAKRDPWYRGLREK